MPLDADWRSSSVRPPAPARAAGGRLRICGRRRRCARRQVALVPGRPSAAGSPAWSSGSRPARLSAAGSSAGSHPASTLWKYRGMPAGPGELKVFLTASAPLAAEVRPACASSRTASSALVASAEVWAQAWRRIGGLIALERAPCSLRADARAYGGVVMAEWRWIGPWIRPGFRRASRASGRRGGAGRRPGSGRRRPRRR